MGTPMYPLVHYRTVLAYHGNTILINTVKFTCMHMCPTNLKWQCRGIAGTNSNNLLHFFQVEMVKMRIGCNYAVDNKDCGMFLAQFEAIHRSTWLNMKKDSIGPKCATLAAILPVSWLASNWLPISPVTVHNLVQSLLFEF